MSQASIVSMWRYPVKWMMGEELNACDVTLRGLFGDRAYAVIDMSTGKLANAKNPLKWPRMFEFRANYVEPCLPARALPAVRATFPDGATGVSGEADIDGRLTASFDRPVRLIAPASHDVQFEGYVPDLEGLAGRNEVFTRTSPSGTFFDIGMVHLLTTVTIDRLLATTWRCPEQSGHPLPAIPQSGTAATNGSGQQVRSGRTAFCAEPSRTMAAPSASTRMSSRADTCSAAIASNSSRKRIRRHWQPGRPRQRCPR